MIADFDLSVVSPAPIPSGPDAPRPTGPSIEADRKLFDMTVEHLRSLAASGLDARRALYETGRRLRGDSDFPVRAALDAYRVRKQIRAAFPAAGRLVDRLELDLAAGLDGRAFDDRPSLCIGAAALRGWRDVLRRCRSSHGWAVPDDASAIIMEATTHGKPRTRAARRDLRS
jgi:hypothetical protein